MTAVDPSIRSSVTVTGRPGGGRTRRDERRCGGVQGAGRRFRRRSRRHHRCDRACGRDRRSGHHTPAVGRAGRRPGRAGRVRHCPGSRDLHRRTVPRTVRRSIPGEPVIIVRGRTSGILTAERTALNLLTHLTGIATDHGTVGDCGGRHPGADQGHPQDAAGAAGPGEVRSAMRWRRQSPDEPRGRRVDQGQPRGCRGICAGCDRGGTVRQSGYPARGRGGHVGATR